MKDNLFVIRSFRLLFQYKPGKLLVLTLLTLFLGINQGFSIALLIPFLQLLEIGEPDSSNQLVQFFNSIIEKTGINISLEVVLISYVVILVLIALLTFWKSIYQSKYQENFSYQIRKRLFRKIILSDWKTLNSKSKHNHLQVLTEEVPKLTNYYYFYLEMLTRLLIAGTHIFFAFMVSVKFTSLVLITGLITFIFLRTFLKKAFSLGSRQVSAFNRILKYIDDFWLTVKIAKVHSSEEFYYKKFNEANKDLLGLQYKLTRNHALPQLLYKILGIVVLVAVVYLGYQIDKVPLASFFILIVLFGRILPQFVSVNNFLNSIFSHIASVRLVINLDEEFEERSFASKDLKTSICLDQGITLDGIHFSYPDGPELFSGFTDTIPAYKMTGIVGESGIGKTTLIDLVAGLQKPTSGKIIVDNKILNDKLQQTWKMSIGYLPQDPFFIDGTIRENLIWDSGEDISDEKIKEVLKLVNAEVLIGNQKNGIDTQIANYQYYFSGGERQRLAMARVLLRKPKLLILDEATSSLDPENEKIIMEVLQSLKKKTTILFVSHRTSILSYFDKILEVG